MILWNNLEKYVSLFKLIGLSKYLKKIHVLSFCAWMYFSLSHNYIFVSNINVSNKFIQHHGQQVRYIMVISKWMTNGGNVDQWQNTFILKYRSEHCFIIAICLYIWLGYYLQVYLGNESVTVDSFGGMRWCGVLYYCPLIKLNITHPFGSFLFSVANELPAKHLLLTWLEMPLSVYGKKQWYHLPLRITSASTLKIIHPLSPS